MRLLATGMLAAWCALATPAAADDSASEANEAFEAGLYARSGTLYLRAFEQTRDPALLRRAALAFRETGTEAGKQEAIHQARRYRLFARDRAAIAAADRLLADLGAAPPSPDRGLEELFPHLQLGPPRWFAPAPVTWLRAQWSEERVRAWRNRQKAQRDVGRGIMIGGMVIAIIGIPTMLLGLTSSVMGCTEHCESLVFGRNLWLVPVVLGSGAADLAVGITLWSKGRTRARQAELRLQLAAGPGVTGLRGAF